MHERRHGHEIIERRRSFEPPPGPGSPSGGPPPGPPPLPPGPPPAWATKAPNTAGEGARHGCPGRLGGEAGATHHYVLREPGRRAKVLPAKREGIPVAPGSVFEVLAGGGGGWGLPEKRSDAARDMDRAEGLEPHRSPSDDAEGARR